MMKSLTKYTLLIILIQCLCIPYVFAQCGNARLAVQVLGSGGPVADDARASSGYLIWEKGKSTILIDAGGGIFQRFGEASGKIKDLKLLGITHFHADHVADLPALLKSGFFSDRTRSLLVSGPRGNNRFPGLTDFMNAMFHPDTGAFRYLSGYLEGENGLFKTQLLEIDNNVDKTTDVLKKTGYRVQAVGVNHWAIPTVGYLLEINGKRIAFSGDQNGDNPAFINLIRDADILFMSHAVPENADSVAGRLHARPSVIGMLANKANVKTLVLSHLMKRSLNTLDENIRLIKDNYKGNIDVADDLKCFALN